MNLHGIVSAAIGAVNPPQQVMVQISTGSATSPDGNRTPTYLDAMPFAGQVQPLQYSDLMQLDGLNIQGQKRKIYITGKVDGLVRSGKQGGDLITTADGQVWLVALVLEYWADWCCVAVVLQNGV